MIAIAAAAGFSAFIVLLFVLRELVGIHDLLDFLCNEISVKDRHDD